MKLKNSNNSIYEKIILEGTKNVVNICDIDTYEILYLNPACKEAYNIKDDSDYINKKCYEVFYGKDSPCSFCNNKKIASEGIHVWKAYNPTSKKYYELTNQFANIGGRNLTIEVGYDIDENYNQIKSLGDKIHLDETLFDCIKTLTENEDLKQSIEKMLEIVCKYYGGNRSYIIELSHDGLYLDNTYEWCKEGVSAEIDNLQNVPKEVAGYWLEQFDKQGCFSISNVDENLDENGEDYRLLKAQGIQSLMAAPLYEKGIFRGFIGVDDPTIKIKDFSLLLSITYFIVNDLQKRRMISELKRLSYEDALTKLYNRNKYVFDIDNMEETPPKSLGVVYIDLNGLKVANDKFGHDYGDFLITKLSEIILSVYDYNNVYRIGGDEFVILCTSISKKDFETSTKKLRENIGNITILSASIGTTWETKNFNIMDTIKHADDLMYANKQRYYQSVKVMGYNRNSSIAKVLIKDIEDGRYKVLLQPKINLNSQTICGAEALVRRTNIDGKTVTPDRFISLYESQGIIRHIDFFVLEAVCKIIKDFKSKGKDIENISVNFSHITLLEERIVDSMINICNDYGISPSKIAIEITDSGSKLGPNELTSLIAKINNAGFYVSLDDYGTKYSDITTLANNEFDEIKIDRSIISQLTANEKTRIIFQHITKMLKELGTYKIVAEGIETIEELDIAKDCGCDYGQGYLFSRPISVDEFLLLC